MNVLVALAWSNHVHHAPARRWFAEQGTVGWATTPVTEVGFVRISSNPTIVPGASSPRAALDVLVAMCRTGAHEFLPDDVRLIDGVTELVGLVGHRQATDAHLLAVARAHRATLVTFDRGVPELAGRLGEDQVQLLVP